MTINPPPIADSIIEKDGKSSLSWILFFNGIYEGDLGTEWTPTFTGLTTVGTPSITGRYYRINKHVALINIVITPATSTTSVAGTTYVDNFPETITADGAVFAAAGGIGTVSGHIVASSNRIYVPAWSAVTVPTSINGICLIQ